MDFNWALLILLFIEVGIDEIFEEVVSRVRVEVNVVVHFLFVLNLGQLIAVVLVNFIKGS